MHALCSIHPLYTSVSTQDISVQAVLAVGSFAGAAAAASYVPDYIDLRDAFMALPEVDPAFQPIVDAVVPILNDIISSLRATAVSL